MGSLRPKKSFSALVHPRIQLFRWSQPSACHIPLWTRTLVSWLAPASRDKFHVGASFSSTGDKPDSVWNDTSQSAKSPGVPLPRSFFLSELLSQSSNNENLPGIGIFQACNPRAGEGGDVSNRCFQLYSHPASCLLCPSWPLPFPPSFSLKLTMNQMSLPKIIITKIRWWFIRNSEIPNSQPNTSI